MKKVFVHINNDTIFFNFGMMSVVPRNGEILQMPYQILENYDEVQCSTSFNTNDRPHYGLVFNNSDMKELPTPYVVVKKVVHCIYSDSIILHCDFCKDGTEDK